MSTKSCWTFETSYLSLYPLLINKLRLFLLKRLIDNLNNHLEGLQLFISINNKIDSPNALQDALRLVKIYFDCNMMQRPRCEKL